MKDDKELIKFGRRKERRKDKRKGKRKGGRKKERTKIHKYLL